MDYQVIILNLKRMLAMDNNVEIWEDFLHLQSSVQLCATAIIFITMLGADRQ